MKLKDLKLGQEITIYEYQFNLDNNIVISKLKYYVHNIIRETWSMFDKTENTTKEKENLTVILQYLGNSSFESNSLEMKSEDEFYVSDTNIKLYSLNNDDETLNKFKSTSIVTLKNKTEYYLGSEKHIHEEYLRTLERLNKLDSSKVSILWSF